MELMPFAIPGGWKINCNSVATDVLKSENVWDEHGVLWATFNDEVSLYIDMHNGLFSVLIEGKKYNTYVDNIVPGVIHELLQTIYNKIPALWHLYLHDTKRPYSEIETVIRNKIR